jgi:hypothetical protein
LEPGLPEKIQERFSCPVSVLKASCQLILPARSSVAAWLEFLSFEAEYLVHGWFAKIKIYEHSLLPLKGRGDREIGGGQGFAFSGNRTAEKGDLALLFILRAG